MKFHIVLDARKTKIFIIFIVILILITFCIIVFSYYHFDIIFKYTPEHFNLNGQLRASLDDSSITTNQANLVFYYLGPKEMSINIKNVQLSLKNGECVPVSIKNLDKLFESDYELFTTSEKVLLIFECKNLTDVFEGNITLPLKDTRTGLYRSYDGIFKITVEN